MRTLLVTSCSVLCVFVVFVQSRRLILEKEPIFSHLVLYHALAYTWQAYRCSNVHYGAKIKFVVIIDDELHLFSVILLFSSGHILIVKIAIPSVILVDQSNDVTQLMNYTTKLNPGA